MAAIPPRPARDADPIGPFLHYLMAECGVSSNTLAAYRSDLMGFIRWRRVAAPGPLAGLDVSTLSDYVESLNQSGLAPSSVCRHLASLSTFFRFLVFEGRLADNVAKLLIAPAVWDRLPTVLSPAAVQPTARGAQFGMIHWAAGTVRCWRRFTRPDAVPRKLPDSVRPTWTW